MLVASSVSEITDGVTSAIGDYGLYAVFVLMAIDAVFPAASEVVMVYAGAVASGAFASAHVLLFGHRISTPVWAYLTMALAGLAGNTLGSLAGWAIGAYGGRPFLERRGRWLHVTPARLDRAERWFEHFGPFAVLVGLSTPVVRSFIALPAGVARMPLVRFAALAFLGCVPWCFGLAGAGWALGRSYDRLHHDFRYVYVATGAALVALVAYLVLRRRSSRLAQRAEHPSG
jgi:membrane protein DedA with SNARE-associated domain